MLDCRVDESESQIVTAFVKQYYHENEVIPKEILDIRFWKKLVIEQWLSNLRKNRVYLRKPQRGNKKRWSKWLTKTPN